MNCLVSHIVVFIFILNRVGSQICSGGRGTQQQSQSFTPSGDLICTNCIRSTIDFGHTVGVPLSCRACGGAACVRNSDCQGMCDHWGGVCGDGYTCQCTNGFCSYSSGICPPGWVSNGGSFTTLRCCPSSANTVVGFYGGLNSDGNGCKCESGYFWKHDAHACIVCPLGSSSAVGATSCICNNNGYLWDLASGTCYIPATALPSTTSTRSVTPSVTPSASRLYPCNAGYFLSDGGCVPCPPGTYSVAYAAVCQLCPAGTFGSHAGLTSAACSGNCATCSAGSTSRETSSLICVSTDARAVPSSIGLQLWPAAHPLNPQDVDLIVAPLVQCEQMTSSAACSVASQIAGEDGLMRYVVGTASALNMEAAEIMTCA